jgi:DNA-binding MarR family transcriptional regulator
LFTVELVPASTDRPANRPAAAVEPLAAEAVRALARASRALERAIPGDLSLAQYRVLSAVAAGDQRASRIAGRLALGKPTISATVESLCQRGLLIRGEVAGDQRAAALHLTASGRAAVRTVEAALAARVTDLAQRSPDPAQLLQALVWLGAALDDYADERTAAEPR